MIIDFIVLMSLSLALRLLITSGSASTDDWGHLLRLRNRRNSSRPFDYRAQKTVFEGVDGYPQFYHYIVSRFPEKYWLIIGKLFNIFLDCVLVLIAPAIVVFWIDKSLIEPLSPELLAGLLAATTPALLPLTDRLKAMGGRVIGAVFFWVYLGGIYFTAFSDNVISIVAGFFLAALAVYLIVLTSQFALQVVFWSAIIVSIFLVNIWPLFVVVLALSLLVIFPRLGAREVLISKYAHWRWYFYNFETTPASKRNRCSAEELSLKRLLASKKATLDLVLRRWTLVIALYSLPSAFIFCYFSLSQPDMLTRLLSDDVGYYLFSILIAMLLAALITSFRYFAFLGESERYLEYSVPAAIAIFIYGVVSAQIPVKVAYLLIFVQLTIVFILQLRTTLPAFVHANFITESDDKDDDTSGLIEFLKSQKTMRIMTIPVKLAHRLGAEKECAHRFYYRLVRPLGSSSYEYLNDDLASFELIDPDFRRLANKYSLDAFVIKKDLLDRAKSQGVDYSQMLSQCCVIYENDSFSVVVLPNLENSFG